MINYFSKTLTHSLFSGLFIFALSNAAQAEIDAASELAKKVQNPIENMITVPFQNNFNFGYGAEKQNGQYILNVEPVIPIPLTPTWNIITRTIIPIARQANLYPSRGYMDGMGDLNPTFFLTPVKYNTLLWGIGPSIFLPTASNKQMGEGKWSIGPSLVMLTMPGNWVIGFLTYNVWSVAGESNRSNVNQFELQYFINYNMPHGWYLSSSPIITANWYAPSHNRWTVPIGAGGGHVFSIGKQPINISLQAFANVVRPDTGPNWEARFTVQFMFLNA